MRQFLFISIVLTAILSCNRHKQQPQQNVPKALDEKKVSYSLISKRGDGDLVESLYNELADETPALKKLEGDIDAIISSKEDSLEQFQKFNSKYNSYYNSAQNHTDLIQDSLLRERIKNLVLSSMSNYNSLTAPHNNILKSIASKETSLSDLHVALKIIKTLPVISKYQKSNLPNTKSLEGYSQQQSKTINEIQKVSGN
jgi:hypothetical protein